MKRYKAEAPNRNYNGRTCGVRFEDGVAIFDDLTVKPENGRSADEIAKILVDDHNYSVSVVNEPGSRKAA